MAGLGAALTNWRFLYRLGITAAIWDGQEEGFGFTCNIRSPMHLGSYHAPRDTLRKNYGRIAFAHSELDGLQHYGPAADEGRRACRQMSTVMAS